MNRRSSLRACMGAALVLGLSCPLGAAAQSDELMLEIDDPEARLDAWMNQPLPDLTLEHWMTGLSIGAGAAAVGLSVAWLAEPSALLGDALPAADFPVTRSVLPVAVLIFGVTTMATGIASLVFGVRDDDLRLRWRAARGGPGAHDERLRIEGAWRARADDARLGRMLSIGAGVITAAGALAALMAFTLGDFEDGDRLMLGAGSGAALLGAALGIVFDLAPSAAERRWEAYDAGLAPPPPPVTVSVTPTFGPSGAGISLQGTF